MLNFYAGATDEEAGQLTAIHDATTIIFLTNPELFSGKFVTVDVDCRNTDGQGETLCSDATIDDDNAVFLLNAVDLPRYQEVLLTKLDSLKE
jgi:pyrimidine-specific ribonucleoside hydrolase/ribosylpyrimidine nucleosidase